MKLSSITSRRLREDISRQDFFDLYSLIAAYQDRHHRPDPKTAAEIERRLSYELSYVYRDHMEQLTRIIFNRLMEEDSLKVYRKWGIPLTPDSRSQSHYVLDKEAVRAVPLETRAAFLVDLLRQRRDEGVEGYFTSNDGAWAKLAAAYPELARAGGSIPSMIRAVDRIHGMTHHGGMLTDYFDERKWIEDALHVRSAGDPGQFLRYASSDVRALVGSALHGSKPVDVSQLQQLGVALNKSLGKSGQATLKDGELQCWYEFRPKLLKNWDGKGQDLYASGRNPKFEKLAVKNGGKVVPLEPVRIQFAIGYQGGEFNMTVGGERLSQKQMYEFYDRRSSKTHLADGISQTAHSMAINVTKERYDIPRNEFFAP